MKLKLKFSAVEDFISWISNLVKDTNYKEYALIPQEGNKILLYVTDDGKTGKELGSGNFKSLLEDLDTDSELKSEYNKLMHDIGFSGGRFLTFSKARILKFKKLR